MCFPCTRFCLVAQSYSGPVTRLALSIPEANAQAGVLCSDAKLHPMNLCSDMTQLSELCVNSASITRPMLNVPTSFGFESERRIIPTKVKVKARDGLISSARPCVTSGFRLPAKQNFLRSFPDPMRLNSAFVDPGIRPSLLESYLKIVLS